MWNLQFGISVLCICNRVCNYIIEMTAINDFVLKKLFYKKKLFLVFFLSNLENLQSFLLKCYINFA